jgi:hypothetical protein
VRAAARDERAERSPLALRIVHALVFVGLCSAAMALGDDEVRQLLFAWGNSYHYGNPPAVLPIVGALFGVVAAALILVHFARGKSVPLWVSMLPLAGILLGYAGRATQAPRRTHYAANLDVLAAARQLHRAQVAVLQQNGELPVDQASWDLALTALQLPKSPARTRSFTLLPFRVALLPDRGVTPEGVAPGTLGVWVSKDGIEFEVHPVGFDEQRKVAPLVDPQGRALVLTGAYNPEMKETEAQPGVQPAPSAWDLPSK